MDIASFFKKAPKKEKPPEAKKVEEASDAAPVKKDAGAPAASAAAAAAPAKKSPSKAAAAAAGKRRVVEDDDDDGDAFASTKKQAVDSASAISAKPEPKPAKQPAAAPAPVEAKKPKVAMEISPDDFFGAGSAAFAAKPTPKPAPPAAAAPPPKPAAPTPAPAAATTASSSSSASAAAEGGKRAREEEAPAATPAEQPDTQVKEGGSSQSKKALKPTPSPQKPISKMGAEEEDSPAEPGKAAAPPSSQKKKKPAAAGASSSQPQAMDVDAASSAPAPPPPRKFYVGQRDTAPPNKGSKTLPVGAPNCLKRAGKELIFVITGTLDSLEREEAEALINKYGGKVTGSVSGKTNYVIRGTDDNGMPIEGSKVTAAKAKGTPIIDEDGLLEMVRKTATQPAPAPAPAPPPVAPFEPPKSSKAKAASEAGGAAELWAEKYRPTDLTHLVGNQDHVRRLLHWLQTWDQEHASALAAAAAGGKKSKDDKVWFKAALLSGAPGVGKTSTAKLLLKRAGYDVVELNASDTRSEKALKAVAVDMVGNTSIADFASGGGGGGGGGGASSSSGGGGGGKATLRKMALIMDEVDGMSAGDRGGVSALIGCIKEAKMPIICICNDRQSQKIKSLANHTLDLRFRRPSPSEVKNALKRVVANEGYNVDDGTLEKIAESCNADIRQMLNLLQIWKPPKDSAGGASKSLSMSDVQSNLKNAFKDLDVGAFDVANNFFLNDPMRAGNMESRLRNYFVDSSMTPLLVYENYLNVSPAVPNQMPPRMAPAYQLHKAVLASEFIALSDVVGKRILSEQQWALAPLHGTLSCIGPGAMMRNATGTGRLQFPMWLGRNSTANKRQRLLREASSHMSVAVSGSKNEVRQSYIPALRPRLLTPLVKRGADGVEETLELMDEYGLTKDDFDGFMEMELLANKDQKSAFATVSTAAKSALTRKYNAAHSGDGITKVKGSKGGGGDRLARFTEEGEDEEAAAMMDDEGEEGDGDEGENDFAKAKPSGNAKAAAPKGKGKGKAKM